MSETLTMSCPSSKFHPCRNSKMNYPNCLLVRSNLPIGGTNRVKIHFTVAVQIGMKWVRYWSSSECAQIVPGL